MPLSGGWPDFGGPIDPRDALWDRIRAHIAAQEAAQERANAQAAADWAEEQARLATAQPDYRTGCPACYLAMTEHDVDVGMNVTQPLFCSHHQWAVAEDLGAFDVWELNDFLTGLRAWVTRACAPG